MHRYPEVVDLTRTAEVSECIGAYAQADRAYEIATSVLAAKTQTIDNQLQMAQVLGRHGFNHVHEALSEDAGGINRNLNMAQHLITNGAAITGRILAEHVYHLNVLSADELTEIYTVSGVLYSFLGRMATAAELLGAPRRLNRNAQYEWAHQDLLRGNDGVQLAMNAIAAAREHCLYGTRRNEKMWLDTAERSLAWTRMHDTDHAERAEHIVARYSQQLHTVQSARRSVTLAP